MGKQRKLLQTGYSCFFLPFNFGGTPLRVRLRLIMRDFRIIKNTIKAIAAQMPIIIKTLTKIYEKDRSNLAVKVRLSSKLNAYLASELIMLSGSAGLTQPTNL